MRVALEFQLRTASLAAFTMLLAAGALHAQQRLATAGRVLDAADQPLATATVTFVGGEPPIGDRFGNADRVVVTTDDKGRFRAELLVGSDYSCWAASSAAADGTRRVSEIADGVRTGTGIELRCERARPASRVRVSGIESWRHVGPLRFEVAVAAAHLHREPLVLVDGAADLPTLPFGAPWFLFAFDRDDNLLHYDRLRALPGEVPFAIPPLREIPARVLDASGAPVAGASIHLWMARGLHRSSSKQVVEPPRLVEWRNVGTTGADGKAVLQVPWHEDPFTTKTEGFLLLASKRDHAGAISGWSDGILVDGHVVETLEKNVIPFTLHAAPSWRGRILDDSGKPLPATAVQLATSLVVGTLHGHMSFEGVFRPRAAEDGWLVFDGLPAALEASTLLVHTSPASPMAASGEGESLRVPALVRAPALLTPAMDRPFEIDLRKLPTLTVRVKDTSGGPARGADVVMLPLPPDNWQPNDATHTFQLDNAGAARTRVQPGRWSVFVTDRVGVAHTTLEVTGTTDLALDLKELAVMHGRVLTTSDSANTRIALAVTSSGHHNMTKDEAVLALRAISSRVNLWLAARTQVSADGTFALRFLDVPNSIFEGSVQADGRSVRLKLVPSLEPIEFDLRAK